MNRHHCSAWVKVDPWRQHHTAAGASKMKYTEDRAVAKAVERSSEVGRPLEAYLCPVCDAWHIGAPSRARRNRRGRLEPH